MEYSETVPVQYERGGTEFMGMNIAVDQRVFIPRPETELLVYAAAQVFENSSLKNPVVLDIGTGSGVIPLGLKKMIPGCTVTGVDISTDALKVAENNVNRTGIRDIDLVCADMYDGLGDENRGIFDAVLSNPPYVSDGDYLKTDAWIKAEPEIAFRSGSEGMDHITMITGKAYDYLKKGGFLALEIGYDQSEKTKELFYRNGYTGISVFIDFNGYERVVLGWKNG